MQGAAAGDEEDAAMQGAAVLESTMTSYSPLGMRAKRRPIASRHQPDGQPDSAGTGSRGLRFSASSHTNAPMSCTNQTVLGVQLGRLCAARVHV